MEGHTQEHERLTGELMEMHPVMEDADDRASGSPAGSEEVRSPESSVPVSGSGYRDTTRLAEPEEEDGSVWGRMHRFSRSEKGALMLVALSGLLNSIQSVAVKFAKSEGVPGIQMVFTRAVLQLFFIVGWLLHNGDEFLGPKHLRKALLARGITGGLGFVCLFHSVATLPIGDATTLYSLHPIFTVLIAFVFLREPVTISVGVAVLASIAGMIFIAHPTFVFGEQDLQNATQGPETQGTGVAWLDNRATGIGAALLTAVLAGAVMVLIRHAKSASTAQQLLPWCVTSIAASGILGSTVQPFVLPATSAIAPAVVCVVVGIAGHVVMTLGARFCPAGSASLMRSTEILWSYMWQVVVFGEQPEPLTYLGVGLDVAALLLVGVETRMKVKRAAAAAQAALQGTGVQGDAESITYTLGNETMRTSPVPSEHTACEFVQTRDDTLSPIPL